MQIINYPHSTLRYTSQPVRRVDNELAKVIRRMFELMYEARGVGLAANQVNMPLRLFIVNLAAEPGKGEELVFLNPVLSRPKGSEEGEEGCLSLPGLYGNVVRSKTIRINAYNLQGEEITAEAEGLLARVLQHENDHLDGVLFFDRMSTTGRMALESQLEELELEFKSRRDVGQLPSDEQLAVERAEWEARYC